MPRRLTTPAPDSERSAMLAGDSLAITQRGASVQPKHGTCTGGLPPSGVCLIALTSKGSAGGGWGGGAGGRGTP